jgi:hypothetical protein
MKNLKKFQDYNLNEAKKTSSIKEQKEQKIICSFQFEDY